VESLGLRDTMSLLTDSLLVGGATFLVGAIFMEINLGKGGFERTPTASNIAKIGVWPYIATFLSGSIGYYSLNKVGLIKD
jgi:hypothetical protein